MKAERRNVEREFPDDENSFLVRRFAISLVESVQKLIKVSSEAEEALKRGLNALNRLPVSTHGMDFEIEISVRSETGDGGSEYWRVLLSEEKFYVDNGGVVRTPGVGGDSEIYFDYYADTDGDSDCSGDLPNEEATEGIIDSATFITIGFEGENRFTWREKRDIDEGNVSRLVRRIWGFVTGKNDEQ